jgi:hypothetical protein
VRTEPRLCLLIDYPTHVYSQSRLQRSI